MELSQVSLCIPIAVHQCAVTLLHSYLQRSGVNQSFSRPHVSDDNPFSEAHFKTLKYQPDYPGLFTGLLHARAWLEPFFEWHNDEHHHCGLALFTPAEVFFERVMAVHAVRQETLDTAYALHPGRFPNGPPQAAMPPAQVHINPLESLAVSTDNPRLADAQATASKSLTFSGQLRLIHSRVSS